MNYKLFLPIIAVLALVLAVTAIGSINIAETTLSMSGAPGAINATEFFTVHNTGGENLAGITLVSGDLVGSGVNISGSAVTFAPASLTLASGANAPVAVILTIPANQKAGTYMGTADATYNSTNRDSLTLVAQVSAVPAYTESATTTNIVQGGSDSITVTITNTGNADIAGMTYRVSTPLVSGANTLTLASSATGSLSVPYAGSTNLNLLFSPPGAQAVGTYSGHINLSYAGIEHTLPISVSVHEPAKSISLSDVIFTESARNVNVSKDVTITNTGDVTLTGVSLTPSGSVTMTGTVPGALVPGSSFVVNVKALVPEDAESGADNVGTLVFSSTQLNKTVNVQTNARSMIEFDSVKVSIDDGSWDSLENGDTVKDDAKPGDTFQVKIKLENLFDDNDEDIDMDDIEVTAIFYGAGEDGDDITEDDPLELDADAGEKTAEEELVFEDDIIDWNAESGKLLMQLFVEAEDDNGAIHHANFTLYINVERENKAEFIFERFAASPNTVDCGRSIVIYVDGRSIGEKSDDEVELKIKNDALGINIMESFSMGSYKEDDTDCNAIADGDDGEDCSVFEYRKTVMIPSNIASGTYTLEGELFRDDGNSQTDENTIDITVSCGSSSSSSSGSSSGSSSTSTPSVTQPSVSTPSTSTPSTSPDASSTTSSVDVLYGGSNTNPSMSARGVVANSATKVKDLTKTDSFADSDAYLALLSILSVLVIAGIIVMIVVLATKPKEGI